MCGSSRDNGGRNFTLVVGLILEPINVLGAPMLHMVFKVTYIKVDFRA